MIKSILIANRGEIAIRIERTCREMGIRTIAVFSEADSQSLHVKLADEAVCIGPPDSRKSYLNISNIISAAVLKGCDAIHPGVGFLSENAHFAREVEKAGLIFIGPEPDTIDLLGDKIHAKQSAIEAGLPVIPGLCEKASKSEKTLEAVRDIGFPVIVKAAAGGGGKGMRIVRKEEELFDALSLASSEAEKSFSDGTVYIEKFIENPKHVEVQLLSDTKGNALSLGCRDCSVQQNHQKLIEETPAPGVSEEIQRRMQADSVRLFKSLGYRGAGTIEYLVKDGSYFFMEVNARVQVEHPVSEMVSGIDIIREQILSASGSELSVKEDSAFPRGWAMECRINAKAPGTVLSFLPPGGREVRVDSFLYQGYRVPPYYDALLAKVIVRGRDRIECIARMDRALFEFFLEGVETNLSSQRAIIGSSLFRDGAYGTDILSRLGKE